MAIIYFILILGITVFIHELGHFMFAKMFKVHVYEFCLGMGPRIFKFNRKNDETDYCIRLFPIGGFVQMAGEELEESDDSIPKEKRLNTKPAYQRFLIMVAGVIMNFLLAIVLLFFIGLFNTVSLNNVYVTESMITGLNNNDKIVAVNGNFVNNYDKLALELTVAGTEDFVLTLKDSSGNKYDVNINPVEVGQSNLPLGKNYGFTINNLKIETSEVVGLNIGDTIKKVNRKEINNYSDLLIALEEITDSVNLTVEDKNSSVKEITVNVTEKENDKTIGNSYGFYLKGEEGKGFITAIKYAFLKFFSTIEQMIFTVFYLITGKISLGMLSGPVGIFSVVSAYSKTGITNIISLLCLICINVGFINLLPIPAFDGAHILFIIIEKIKGSKVNPKIQNTINTVGFILLMILMVLITFNDILRLL